MKLKIIFTNEQNKEKAGFGLRRLIKKAVKAALECENFGYDCTVSVTFTDNEQIREKNREFRGIDSATDVLSFPMYDIKNGDMPFEGEIFELGDIVLSLERARRAGGGIRSQLRKGVRVSDGTFGSAPSRIRSRQLRRRRN